MKEDYYGFCQYDGCGKQFETKRRWTKKYCSDSCRTLASRYRKSGMAGSKTVNPRSKGVNDLFGLSQQQQTELIQWLDANFKGIAQISGKVDILGYDLKDLRENMPDLQSKVRESQTRQEIEMKKIQTRLDSIERSLDKITLAMAEIRSKQASQDWVVILSSILGPKVGDWLEKTLVGSGKSENQEMTALLNHVKNLLESGKNS